MQSRRHSALETAANVLVGYALAVASQMLIFPQFGIAVPVRANFVIGLWFTAASIVRSYAMRRLFNRFDGGNRGQ